MVLLLYDVSFCFCKDDPLGDDIERLDAMLNTSYEIAKCNHEVPDDGDGQATHNSYYVIDKEVTVAEKHSHVQQWLDGIGADNAEDTGLSTCKMKPNQEFSCLIPLLQLLFTTGVLDEVRPHLPALLQNEIDNQSSQQSLNALYAKVDKNKTHKNLKGVECTSTSDEIKLCHISIQPSGLLMKSTSSQDLKDNGTEVNDPRRHSALPASGDFSGDATYDVPDCSPTAKSTQMIVGEKFQPTYDEDWSQLQTLSVEKLQVLSFTLYGYVSNGDTLCIIGHVRSRIYISYWWKVGKKYSTCKQ